MVIEGMIVVPLSVLYMFFLLRDMCQERANLFCVFLRVPRPTVVAIVKQRIKVGEGDEDDEDAAVEDQVRHGVVAHMAVLLSCTPLLACECASALWTSQLCNFATLCSWSP